jgi:hypothetical protein
MSSMTEELQKSKVIGKLQEFRNDLRELKSVNNEKGRGRLSQISSILDRIIERVYPEKDATRLKSEAHPPVGCVIGCRSQSEYEAEEEQDYQDEVDNVTRVVETILEEHELFGLEDFEPKREKKETEWQVGHSKIGYIKKKTTK